MNIIRLLLPVLIFCLPLFCFGYNCSIAQVQYDALEDLYDACHGEYWLWAKNESTVSWKFPSLLSAPCNDNWQGLVCQLTSDASICAVVNIHLPFMNLTGYIPATVGNISTLESLDLGNNNIVSTIPNSFSEYSNMSYLKLHDNFLEGSLPDSLYDLTALTYLNLDGNLLTGTISSGIGNLKNLTTLHLSINSLDGWIPTQFGELTKLKMFDLSVTLLSGPIPTELGNIVNVSILSLHSASLDGTIPTQLGLCTNMLVMYLNDNYLQGTIPAELENMNLLQFLSVNNNLLDGTVPVAIPRIAALSNLQVNNNFLNGTNMLVTGISAAMSYLALGTNFFTGTIPMDWTSFKSLQYLFLNGNLISGTLPSDLVMATYLLQLSLSNNLLSGSIPPKIGNEFTRKLNSFTISDNQLTGTLPSNMVQMSQLQTLNLSSNSLSGPVTQVFPNEDMIVFPNMTYLFLDHNGLEGVVSASLFTSQSLKVIAINSNCFSGTLPPTVCASPTLQAFATTAATAAKQCWLKLPKWLTTIVGGVFRTRRFTSSLPSCLWQIQSLLTLHVAANDIPGIIPAGPMPPDLVNLEIGYNALTGTVPLSLQEHGKFSYLTLRHNKFTGMLSDSFAIHANNSDIQLFVNRLSGPIPPAFFVQSTINMLNGNLFQCSSGNKLPQSDPNSRNYSCGSNNYNDSWYLWLGWMGAFVIVIGGLLGYVYYASRMVNNVASQIEANNTKKYDREYESQQLAQTLLSKFQQFVLNVYNNSLAWSTFKLSPELAEMYTNTGQFLLIMKQSTFCVGIVSAVYFFVVMVAYIIMKNTSNGGSGSISTVYRQYAWVTTSSYMHGAAPAVVISIALYGAICFIFIGMKDEKQEAISRAHDNTIEETSQTVFFRGCRLIYLVRCGIQIFNGIVTFAVNAIYVLVLENGNITPSQQFFLEIAVTSFKLAWGAAFIPFTMKYFITLPAGYRLFNQVFMYCFLLILAPLSASAVTSESCFLHVFQPAPTIQVSYAYTQNICVETANIKDYNGTDNVVFTTVCTEESIVTNAASYDQPPFNYSYQCGSTILAFYLPILVYSFIFSSMILPAIRFTILHTYHHLQKIVPIKLYKLLVSDSLLDCDDILFVYGLDLLPSGVKVDVSRPTQLAPRHTLSSSSPLVTGAPDTDRIFDGTTVISKRLVDIAVVITFGLASPILGMAVFISVFVNSFIWYVMVGKYLTAVTPENEVAFVRLEVSTRGLLAGCYSALWVVVLVSCCFWSIMLYDMVADVYHDTSGTIAVIFIVIGVPIFVYISLIIWGSFDCNKMDSEDEVLRESSVRESMISSVYEHGSVSEADYRQSSVTSMYSRPTSSIIDHNSEFL